MISYAIAYNSATPIDASCVDLNFVGCAVLGLIVASFGRELLRRVRGANTPDGFVLHASH